MLCFLSVANELSYFIPINGRKSVGIWGEITLLIGVMKPFMPFIAVVFRLNRPTNNQQPTIPRNNKNKQPPAKKNNRQAIITFTPPETKSSPLKTSHPKKERIVFQASIFRCELLVSGRAPTANPKQTLRLFSYHLALGQNGDPAAQAWPYCWDENESCSSFKNYHGGWHDVNYKLPWTTPSLKVT